MRIGHQHSYLVILCSISCTLGAVPAFAGPPFTTDDTGMPDPGHFEINIFAQYVRFNGGSNATIPTFEVNYTLINRLEVVVDVPLALAQVDGTGANAGLGDIRLGLKYRFVDSDPNGWRPAVAFAPAIMMPAGNEARGLGNGRMQGFLPIWLTKDFGDWTIFGGGGYNINPGPDRLNWWFTGLGVKRQITSAWSVGGELFYTTPARRGTKDSTAFNVAVIYDFNNYHHVMASVGRNLTHAKENNELSAFAGYQLTF